MFPFLFYSLQVAICLGVLYLLYHLLLKGTTFHHWNRLYLLGAIIFSLLAPLGEFKIPIAPLANDKFINLVEGINRPLQPTTERIAISPNENRETFYQPITQHKQQLHQAVNQSLPSLKVKINWWVLAYFSGFVIAFGLFLFRLGKVFIIYSRGVKKKGEGFTEVHVPFRDKQVFSFFGFIFLNKEHFSEKEYELIIQHEKVHIQQFHGLDVVQIELLQALFWFNPLFWLYRKAIQSEHEYLADRQTAEAINKSQYAQALLNLATAKQPILGNAFAYVPINHRIVKLFQKPSSTIEKSKYWAMLPLIVLLFIGFSCSFDKMEEIGNEVVVTGSQVREVKAYFINEHKTLKSKVLMGTISFDGAGGIVQYAQKVTIGSIGKDFPHYLLYFTNQPFEFKHRIGEYLTNLGTDFYPMKVPWLLLKDPLLKDNEILFYNKYSSELVVNEDAMLVYNKYSNMLALFDIDIMKNQGYNVISIAEQSGSISAYTMERVEEGGKTRVTIQIDYNASGQPLYRHKKREYLPDNIWGNNLKTLRDSIHNRGKLAYSAKEQTIQMTYAPDKLLSAMTFSSEAILEGRQNTEERKYSIRYSYDEKQRFKEMEFYNEKGLFLRKYRYTYNEQGYCTKTSMINRDDSEEFSVLFEYDFYPIEQ
ncbi:MAG: M56 family metallopeptidase [Bacteroidota bacterium]